MQSIYQKKAMFYILVVLLVSISCQNDYPKFYHIQTQDKNITSPKDYYFISQVFLSSIDGDDELEMGVYLPQELKVSSTDTIVLNYRNQNYNLYLNNINQWKNQDKVLTFIDKKPVFKVSQNSNDLFSYSKSLIDSLKFELKNKTESIKLSIDNRTEVVLGVYKKDNDIIF